MNDEMTMNLQSHKSRLLKSSSLPPIRDFQPSASMHSKFDPRKLVFYLPP